MASFGNFYFSAAQIEDSPSRRTGVDEATETRYRQEAAMRIQRFRKAGVSQTCINTAIVFMHRFYMWHSFVNFHRHGIVPTALFLAMKVHGEPMPLERLIHEAFRDLLRNDEGSTLTKSKVSILRYFSYLRFFIPVYNKFIFIHFLFRENISGYDQ